MVQPDNGRIAGMVEHGQGWEDGSADEHGLGPLLSIVCQHLVLKQEYKF